MKTELKLRKLKTDQEKKEKVKMEKNKKSITMNIEEIF